MIVVSKVDIIFIPFDTYFCIDLFLNYVSQISNYNLEIFNHYKLIYSCKKSIKLIVIHLLSNYFFFDTNSVIFFFI